MNVQKMKAAVFPDEVDRPGRIAFTMTRLDLLRLSWNALKHAIRGDEGIAISTGDLEVLGPAPCSTSARRDGDG